MGFVIATVDARFLASPILQEYDAFTVAEIAMHPAEFGNLANRITLWKSQKPVGREADVGTVDRLAMPPASVQPVEIVPAVCCQALLVLFMFCYLLSVRQTILANTCAGTGCSLYLS